MKEGYAFSDPKTGTGVLTGNLLWKLFKLFELDEIMRQKDDLTFAQSLTRFAVGELTPEDIALFESRCFASDADLPEEARQSIRLIWQNKDVDAYNSRRLREIHEMYPSNQLKIVHCSDNAARGDYTESQKQWALEKAKNLPAQKTHGLPTLLKLQVGARYIVTTNIDVADGLFNGATGVLQQIDENSGVVFIKFDDSKVGKKARTVYPSFERGIDSSWTPVMKQKKEFSASSSVSVVREQYPLSPAEAITINKSQGQSVESAVVHLDKGMDRSLLYVAFSRVTNINGLYLIGKFVPPKPPSFKHGPTIEMKRMRQDALLIPKFQHLRQVPNGTIQIISHNVQSLRIHAKSIESDPVYFLSHLLLLQETWLHNKELISIKGFAENTRSCTTGVVRGRGTIIYNNDSLHVQKLNSAQYKSNDNDQYFELSACKIGNITFLNAYLSPNCSTSFFTSCFDQYFSILNSSNVVLCGDFNDDILQSDARINYFQQNYGLNLVSPKEATTTNGTCLDAVFTNCSDYNIEVYIYETYFSYHKPLLIRLIEK